MKELFDAQTSIKIAVAWFTSIILFKPLLLKLQLGVNVELILNYDEINVSDDNEVDFDVFVKTGGVIHWNKTRTLMHDKFCIIDDRTVITGSYNWTNKAEGNDESISVFIDEAETIAFYRNKFSALSTKYKAAGPIMSNKTFVTKDIGEKRKELVSNTQIVSEPLRINIPSVKKIEKTIIKPEAEGECGENCTFRFEKNGTLTISPTKEKGRARSATYDYFDLTLRPWNPFQNRIKRIICEADEIGVNAFRGSVFLKEVILKGTQIIKDNAFSNCIQLENVSGRSTIEHLSKEAFLNCCLLKKSIMAKKIGERCFSGCSSLKGLITNSVDYYYILDNKYFKVGELDYFEGYRQSEDQSDYCESTIIENVGEYAFENCKGIQEVAFSDKLSSISSFAFFGCSSLKRVYIGRGIINTGTCLFKDCNNLKALIIPSFFKEHNPPLLENGDIIKTYEAISCEAESKRHEAKKQYEAWLRRIEIDGQLPLESYSNQSVVVDPDRIPNDDLQGYGFGSVLLFEDEVYVFPDTGPNIVRCIKHPKIDKWLYFVKVHRILGNELKSEWMNLADLIVKDSTNKPLGAVQEIMLSFNTWNERLNYLIGKIIKTGKRKEYEMTRRNPDGLTTKTVKRKLCELFFLE